MRCLYSTCTVKVVNLHLTQEVKTAAGQTHTFISDSTAAHLRPDEVFSVPFCLTLQLQALVCAWGWGGGCLEVPGGGGLLIWDWEGGLFGRLGTVLGPLVQLKGSLFGWAGACILGTPVPLELWHWGACGGPSCPCLGG